jgi:Tfp pilus assembly protein PilF
MKNAVSMPAAGMVLAIALSGCVHTGFGSNKNPQQAAQANIQLAIEYMKMDKLAVSRDYL